MICGARIYEEMKSWDVPDGTQWRLSDGYWELRDVTVIAASIEALLARILQTKGRYFFD